MIESQNSIFFYTIYTSDHSFVPHFYKIRWISEKNDLTSEHCLTAEIISVVTWSTVLIGAVASCSTCSLTIRSKARSGVKRPDRTPRMFWITILISFLKCFSSIFRSAEKVNFRFKTFKDVIAGFMVTKKYLSFWSMLGKLIRIYSVSLDNDIRSEKSTPTRKFESGFRFK